MQISAEFKLIILSASPSQYSLGSILLDKTSTIVALFESKVLGKPHYPENLLLAALIF